jgi:hypothetical protein
MVAEIIEATDFGKGPGIVYMGDIQHVTMYLFFFLSGLCDVLVQRQCRVAVPGLDYAAGSLAFAVEWLLFSEHLRGRSPLDVHVHSLLLYVIAACVGVTLLEYKCPHNVLFALMRCAMVLLQGTWFFQVAFILHPPSPSFHHWDEQDHQNLMLATVLFIWHLGGCLVFVVLIFALLCKLYDSCCATFELDADGVALLKLSDIEEENDTDIDASEDETQTLL